MARLDPGAHEPLLAEGGRRCEVPSVEGGLCGLLPEEHSPIPPKGWAQVTMTAADATAVRVSLDRLAPVAGSPLDRLRLTLHSVTEAPAEPITRCPRAHYASEPCPNVACWAKVEAAR